jgi:hypothetical protein
LQPAKTDACFNSERRLRLSDPMAAPSKSPVTPAIKRPARSAPTQAAASQPSLRFYISDDLRTRTLTALASIEHSSQPTRHRDALANIAIELAHAGMDYFFIKQLERANVGFVIQTSASIGMAGVVQLMGTVIRNIIGRMDGRQLLSLCGSIRQFMR